MKQCHKRQSQERWKAANAVEEMELASHKSCNDKGGSCKESDSHNDSNSHRRSPKKNLTRLWHHMKGAAGIVPD